MARYFENTTTFNFSWDQVACGYWKRYPNPQSTHVLSEDTWSRQVRDGCLYTKRVLTKTNRVPKWGERFFNAKSVKIIEESIVDPKEKVLVTYTRNLGYTKVMSVVERVEYRSVGGQTIAHRSAWIDSQVFGFSRAIRAFGVDRFRKNCTQMVNGFNHVLHAMFPRASGAGGGGVGGGAPVREALREMRDAAAAATDRAKHNVLSSVNTT
ncbi:PREDICTED: protein preli-like [Papilio xuthus]|uniref:Protein preli-like n=1 Tax=Papilio xuthus TaxID=66420 RepID=A0AAJ6ZE28_PAPXU|nr:PREDICTED: protein preli-like [Papilio xuthus]XP_013170544.1 PREDICTED: protein preli-like [Papilio xuthus]XP_013170545.1 PREDICTED: protein preli-like [Papilio xuthus]